MEVLTSLFLEERVVSGEQREVIGHAALGFARFLRRQRWVDKAAREAGLALADCIAALGRKYLATPFPREQA